MQAKTKNRAYTRHFMYPKRSLFRAFIPGFIAALCIAVVSSAQSVSYQPLLDESSGNRSIDVSLPVGAIEGKHGTSPAGGATYSIPIKMAPGSNGLVPGISLEYNSQSGNGHAGYGWNIGGISVIEQTNASMIYDGETAPIFDPYVPFTTQKKHDRLMLDGERLIRTSDPQAPTPTLVFANSKGIKVEAVGNYPGDYHYTYTDKEGTKYEYGLDDNSRIFKADGTDILKWYISKVSDINGFYIDFKYQKIANEVMLAEIDYTGNMNAGIAPYNKIKFTYEERDDANTVYIAGTAIGQNYLPDRIDVIAENDAPVYTYQLNYGHDNKIINNKYSFLNEVVLYGSDNSHLNSTIFKYGNGGTEFEVTPTSVVVGGDERATGDFDGDGISDIAIIKTNGNPSGNIVYTFYKGNSTGQNMQQMGSLTLPSTTSSPQRAMFGLVKYDIPVNIQSHFSSDFDGDGNDDLLVGAFQAVGGDTYLRKLILIRYSGGTFTSQDIALPNTPGHEYKTNDFKNPITIGDFNGDRWPDVFITARDITAQKDEGFMVYYLGRTATPQFVEMLNYNAPNSSSSLIPELSRPDYMAVIDHDGDGKNELLTVLGAKTKIFTLDHNMHQFDMIHEGAYPTVWHDVYTGDFNGDGKTDLLTKVRSSDLWEIAYSDGQSDYKTQPFNGTGKLIGDYYDQNREFNRKTGPIPDHFYESDQIIVADFNGDGKSDIIHAVPFSEGGSAGDYNNRKQRLNTYFSNGNNSFNNKVYIYNSWLSTCTGCVLPNDMNGDGRADLFTAHLAQQTGGGNYTYLIKFNTDGQEKVLQKVTNGYNVETEFQYEYLNKSAIYSRSNSFIDKDIPYVKFPLLAISQVHTRSLASAPAELENTGYQYQDATFSKRGLGFIGFRKTITTDYIQEKQTEQEMQFTINPDNVPVQPGIFYVLPRIASTSIYTMGGQLLSSSKSAVRVNNNGVTNAIVEKTEVISDLLANTSSTTVSNYDDRVNVIKSTSDINNVETTSTDYLYSTFGATSKPVYITTTSTRQGQPGVTDNTALNYTGDGKLYERIEFEGLPQQVSHRYSYNTAGLLASELISSPGVQSRDYRIEYDDKARFAIRKINALGKSEYFTYDARSGAVTGHTGFDQNTVTYEHDAYFNLTKTIYPKGNAVSTGRIWQLDGINLIATSQITEGGSSEIKYIDAAGRATINYSCFQATPITFWGMTFMFPKFAEANFAYDAKGNKISEEQPHYSGTANYLTTSYTYDYLNRVTSACNQLGCSNYSYSYSGGSNAVTTMLPSGQIQKKITDPAGKITASTDAGGSVYMDYDSRGNMIATRLGSPSGTPIVQNKYDEYNRKVTSTERNTGTYSYTYDAYGELVSQKDPNGNVHKYTYDVLGRMESRNGTEGTTKFYYKNATLPGEAFQLEKVVDFNNEGTGYDYNQYGEQTGMHKEIRGKIYEYGYAYDQYGRLTNTIYPDGSDIEKVYNNYGTWMEVKWNSNTLYKRTTIDGSGKTLAAERGNGLTTNFTYDYDYLTRIQSPVMDYNLEYDYSTRNIIRRLIC